MRYAARVDDNQSDICKALEQIGALVVDCSHVGEGFPDLLVGYRGQTIMLEIKDGAKPPSRRKLTPAQVIFHADWLAKGGPLATVKTVDEALAIVGRIGVNKARAS